MKKFFSALALTVAAAIGPGVTLSAMTQSDKSPTNPLVEINTTEGRIVVELFNDTPLHRDNFLRLADDGFYDGVLFHRVVPGFVIQAGDPDSRTAAGGTMLGSGGPGYDIDAEIVAPVHFHRRGALAAAREGDDTNPLRRSSGSQFYIVTGRTLSEGQLRQMEHQANLQLESEIAARLNAEYRDSIMSLRRARDFKGLGQLQDALVEKADAEASAKRFRFTDEQRRAYTTEGGTPALDGKYTVYGQVVEGMDTVEKIEAHPADANERPESDVRILSVKVLRR